MEVVPIALGAIMITPWLVPYMLCFPKNEKYQDGEPASISRHTNQENILGKPLWTVFTMIIFQ